MSLVRVFGIPPISGDYHFAGGTPVSFIEVDWFRDDDMPPMSDGDLEQELRRFISEKRYAKFGRPLLVLHPRRSFTIGYEAP